MSDSGARRLWSHANLTTTSGVSGGPNHFAYFSAHGLSDVRFQWIMHEVASGAPGANITIYSTAESDRQQFVTDPLNVNEWWTDETPFGAVFGTLPGTVVKSDRISFKANDARYYLVQVEVLVDLPDFTFVINQQSRGS